MMKKILIILFLALLIIPSISAFELSLPIAEHKCFNEFADGSKNYSILQRIDSNRPNINELRVNEPNITHIIISNFNELCRFTENPDRCYECVTLSKYGVWEQRKNQTQIDYNGNNSKKTGISSLSNILFIVGVILIIIIIAQLLLSKAKIFKHIKTKKINGKKRTRNKKEN